MTVGLSLVRERGDVGVHHGLDRRRQHPGDRPHGGCRSTHPWPTRLELRRYLSYPLTWHIPLARGNKGPCGTPQGTPPFSSRRPQLSVVSHYFAYDATPETAFHAPATEIDRVLQGQRAEPRTYTSCIRTRGRTAAQEFKRVDSTPGGCVQRAKVVWANGERNPAAATKGTEFYRVDSGNFVLG